MYFLKNKFFSKIKNLQLDPELFKIMDKLKELEWVKELNAKEIKEQKQIKE